MGRLAITVHPLIHLTFPIKTQQIPVQLLEVVPVQLQQVQLVQLQPVQLVPVQYAYLIGNVGTTTTTAAPIATGGGGGGGGGGLYAIGSRGDSGHDHCMRPLNNLHTASLPRFTHTRRRLVAIDQCTPVHQQCERDLHGFYLPFLFTLHNFHSQNATLSYRDQNGFLHRHGVGNSTSGRRKRQAQRNMNQPQFQRQSPSQPRKSSLGTSDVIRPTAFTSNVGPAPFIALHAYSLDQNALLQYTDHNGFVHTHGRRRRQPTNPSGYKGSAPMAMPSPQPATGGNYPQAQQPQPPPAGNYPQAQTPPPPAPAGYQGGGGGGGAAQPIVPVLVTYQGRPAGQAASSGPYMGQSSAPTGGQLMQVQVMEDGGDSFVDLSLQLRIH